MRRIMIVLFVIVGISYAGCRCPFMPKQDKSSEWADCIHEIHLKNGMNFIICPRGEAPIFSAYMRFKVGGLEEQAGQAGLAHFLEHMAFKGTEKIGTRDFEKEKVILQKMDEVGEALSAEYAKEKQADLQKVKELKNQLATLYEEQKPLLVQEAIPKIMMENGGVDMNATTSKDVTSYFVNLPADRIGFWAELESARIFKPIFREFYQEKDVVLEERRMRVDNNPEGLLYESFIETAFQKSPYHFSTIGRVEDILKLTRKDLEKFFKLYYRPSRMTGVLVGKLDVKETQKILEDTFGQITFEGEDPVNEFVVEPPQTEVRRVTLKLPHQSRFLVGYHKPTMPDKDDYTFDVFDQILGEGRSSILYQLLVEEKKVALAVETGSGIPGSRLPNLFTIQVTPLPGHTTDEIIKIIEDKLKKIEAEGVSAEELTRAKNKLAVDFVWHLKTNEGMASQISYYQVLDGSWKYLDSYLENIEKISSADIQSIAKKYLQPSQKTIAEIVSEPSAKSKVVP